MNLTFVLLSCGEMAESECLAAIQSHSNQFCLKQIRNVHPQIKALNLMIDVVETEFFVPLDADIVLNKDGCSRIISAIEANQHDSSWHTILFPLWDTLTEKRILALKIMRTAVMKANPFKESATPDVEHHSRLTALGYRCLTGYLPEEPIGRHIVRGRHFCYHKYRDVYQTYRSHNFEWDSGAFLGGSDLRSKAKAHFDYFFFKYVQTSNEDYLHCIAGMMDGILSPIEHRSKTLENRVYRLSSLEAVSQFMTWYFAPLSNRPSGSYLF